KRGHALHRVEAQLAGTLAMMRSTRSAMCEGGGEAQGSLQGQKNDEPRCRDRRGSSNLIQHVL
ncbi:MAG: hypothetical protein WBF03_03015, partial [Xanthobacteraceae bacterium]